MRNHTKRQDQERVRPRDLAKRKKLNPNGQRWFLAFLRAQEIAKQPQEEIEKSFKRKNGLREDYVKLEPKLIRSFPVFRPNGEPDEFGVVLLKGL
jgi:hypothetical protein